MKSSYILLVIASCFLIESAHAQLRVAFSNRFMIKTDAMHWLVSNASNAEIEIRIKERSSISIGYLKGHRKYKAVFLGRYGSEVEMPEKGFISSQLMTMQWRRYKNRAVGAYRGAYFSVLLGAGEANGSSIIPTHVLDDSPQPINDGDITFLKHSFKNIPILRASIGWGYQCVIAGRLFLDMGLSIDNNQFFYKSMEQLKILSGVFTNFGPTLPLGKTFANASGIISAYQGFNLAIKLGYKL